MDKQKDDVSRKSGKSVKNTGKKKPFFTDERIKFVIGILITGFALYLLLACVAYLFWWKTDQSIPDSDIVSGPEIEVRNWSGKSGHFLAKMIISHGFGFGAFFIPLIFGALGLYLLNFPKIRIWSLTAKFAFATIITVPYPWLYFRTGRRLPVQRTGRCSGLSGIKMAECLYR